MAKLVPTLPPESVLGVRMPDCRSLARELCREPDIGLFLADLPHRYLDENNLHALILNEEKDYAAAFASLPKISWKGHCMYCGHCAPCPKGIDVASVTKFFNLAKAQGQIPETVREHYMGLPSHAGACIACGACENRCPFGVPIIRNMADAAALFGL